MLCTLYRSFSNNTWGGNSAQAIGNSCQESFSAQIYASSSLNVSEEFIVYVSCSVLSIGFCKSEIGPPALGGKATWFWGKFCNQNTYFGRDFQQFWGDRPSHRFALGATFSSPTSPSQFGEWGRKHWYLWSGVLRFVGSAVNQLNYWIGSPAPLCIHFIQFYFPLQWYCRVYFLRPALRRCFKFPDPSH